MKKIIFAVLMLWTTTSGAAQQAVTQVTVGATESVNSLKTKINSALATPAQANFVELYNRLDAYDALGLGTSGNPSFSSIHASGGNLAAANAQVTKKWITGLPYTANLTSVIYGGKHYICTSTHTAGASTEPGVGASWTTVWAESAAGGAYTLPMGSSTVLGGIKVGSRLSIDGSGVLSADVQSGTGAVDSVNGQIGIVVLDADDISDASTTKKFTTSAEKADWNAKLGALPSWLPATGPTADNQIIQATGAGTSTWTSIVDGLINDAGTGTDDLLSALEINFRIATAAALKQNALGFTPENAASKGQANGYAGLGSDGKVPANQLPTPVIDTDDQTAAEVAVSTTNFGGNLSSVDNTVQKALDTLDNITVGGAVNLTAPGPIGSVTPSSGTFTTLIANSFDFGAPATGETGEIGLQENPANGNNMITLKAPAALAADLVITLPTGVVPATATAPGVPGQWWYDANYWYVCISANTWKRTALATW